MQLETIRYQLISNLQVLLIFRDTSPKPAIASYMVTVRPNSSISFGCYWMISWQLSLTERVGSEMSAPCLAVIQKKEQKMHMSCMACSMRPSRHSRSFISCGSKHTCSCNFLSMHIKKGFTMKVIHKMQFIVLFKCDSRNPSHQYFECFFYERVWPDSLLLQIDIIPQALKSWINISSNEDQLQTCNSTT